MASGTPVYVANYTTGALYVIAPLERLLPLQSPPGGCAIAAFTLFVAPCVRLATSIAIAACIGLVVRATIGRVPESHAPAWRTTVAGGLILTCVVGATVIGGVTLIRKARRARARNAALWAQGRAELDAACRRCLDVEPVA